jgi:prephenate dehydrogenase
MTIRQITIIGTGLIGGSFGLAVKKRGFKGRIVGCDRVPVLKQARALGAIDDAQTDPATALKGSQLVLLATPVGTIIELIRSLGPSLPAQTLLADVGSTKAEVVACATATFGRQAGRRFLAGHPMAGKEQAGVEGADADLFQGAVWFVTPVPGQNMLAGLGGEFLDWVEKTGAQVAGMNPDAHDQLCSWISHLPQFISTALAATLVDEYGEDAPLLETGGRALREMTRISGSPYSMWRDVALTNKKNIRHALLRLEQRLAHIRENLDTKELALEFERAHHLRKSQLQKKTSPQRREVTEKVKTGRPRPSAVSRQSRKAR